MTNYEHLVGCITNEGPEALATIQVMSLIAGYRTAFDKIGIPLDIDAAIKEKMMKESIVFLNSEYKEKKK